MEGINLNENQLRQMLQLAAQRMHTTPEALKAAAENGTLQNMAVRGDDPEAQMLRRVLSDPEAAKKLLSTPAAQKLFRSLGGRNR